MKNKMLAIDEPSSVVQVLCHIFLFLFLFLVR